MNTKKEVQVGKDAKLRKGLATVMGKSAKMQVQGEEVKVSDVLDSLDQRGAHAQATEDARVAFRSALGTEKEYRAKTHPMISAVCAHLATTLSPEQLTECGLTPRRSARVLTFDERTAKGLKVRATRTAKGTRGKRQARQEKAKATITAVYASNGNGAAPSAPPPGPLPRDGGNSSH
jgi:hypothetical protein